MLVNFTDDYVNEIYEGHKLIACIMHTIAEKEPFYGKSKALDKLYFQSAAIGALIDHLESDNNSTPEDNEYLLQCLKEILSKNICGCSGNHSTPQYQQPTNTITY
jgi:hypothetical protein